MILGNILFFLMLFAPAAWQFIKIPIVIIAVALLLFHYIRRIRNKLSPVVILWFAIFMLYGIIWNFIAALKGNPGFSDTFRLYVIWVALYALYVFYIDSIEKFNSLVRTMVWATLAISLYNFAILLSALDLIPNINSFLRIDDELTEAVGIHAGFIQMVSNNIGSLAFLSPFVLALHMSNPHSIGGVTKKILRPTVVLSIFAVLISGRRALWIEILVTPVLILMFNYFDAEKNTRKITRNILKFGSLAVLMLTAVGFFLTYQFNWQLSPLVARFLSAFGSGVRHDQAIALFKGFLDSPLLGAGFGIGVEDVVRSEIRPWSYELTYVLMLYNTGVIGSALYAFCAGIIYVYGIKYIMHRSCDNGITSSLLVAFTCFIIANSTNPYFGTYDYMWMFYLPIAYINAVESERQRQFTAGAKAECR